MEPNRTPQQRLPPAPKKAASPKVAPATKRCVYETLLVPRPVVDIVSFCGVDVKRTCWFLPASVVDATKDDDINEVARAVDGAPEYKFCGLTQWQLPDDHQLVVDSEEQLSRILESDLPWMRGTLDFTPDPVQTGSKKLNFSEDWDAMKELLEEQREELMTRAREQLKSAGNEAAVAATREKLLKVELPEWQVRLKGAIVKKGKNRKKPQKRKKGVDGKFTEEKKPPVLTKVTDKEAACLAEQLASFISDRLRGEKQADRARTKYFFPTYGYGQGTELPKNGWCPRAPLKDPTKACERCGGMQKVSSWKCNDMPDWLKEAARTVLETTAAAGLDCINQVVMNVYHKRGAKLVGHYDSAHVFREPIVSLRLLEAAELSFGVFNCPSMISAQDSNGRSDKPRLFAIPLPRGVLTRMEGFAARTVKHAIMAVERGPTASIIFRQLHEELLSTKEDKAWLRRNRVRRAM